jgi:hypothetical protein
MGDSRSFLSCTVFFSTSASKALPRLQYIGAQRSLLRIVFNLSTSSCGAEWLQRDCRVTSRAERELPLRITGRAVHQYRLAFDLGLLQSLGRIVESSSIESLFLSTWLDASTN